MKKEKPLLYAEKWVNEAEPFECNECGAHSPTHNFTIMVIPSNPDFPDQGAIYTIICQECGNHDYVFAMP